MSRSSLKSESHGFPVYGDEQLPKVNTMRADKSQPDFMGVPILHDGQVMLLTAEQLGDKPASCYSCTFKRKDDTCRLIGPEIKVTKVMGSKKEGEPIEYWPCCSMQNPGEPEDGDYISRNDPSALGLIWINAPEPGLKYSGANCAGINGGDDCDHYQIDKGKKWDTKSGFCRVLQHEVGAGQVCAAWQDDDELSWEDAQQLIHSDKHKMAKQIIGRDD